MAIVAVEFKFRNKPMLEVVFNGELPRMSERTFTGRIDEWPTPSDLRVASAVARIKLPVGDEDAVTVELELKSKGFYEREDPLGELL